VASRNRIKTSDNGSTRPDSVGGQAGGGSAEGLHRGPLTTTAVDPTSHPSEQGDRRQRQSAGFGNGVAAVERGQDKATNASADEVAVAGDLPAVVDALGEGSHRETERRLSTLVAKFNNPACLDRHRGPRFDSQGLSGRHAVFVAATQLNQIKIKDVGRATRSMYHDSDEGEVEAPHSTSMAEVGSFLFLE